MRTKVKFAYIAVTVVFSLIFAFNEEIQTGFLYFIAMMLQGIFLEVGK
jgi:hypothetical protein